MDFKWPSFTNIVRNYHMEGEFYNPLMQVSLSFLSFIWVELKHTGDVLLMEMQDRLKWALPKSSLMINQTSHNKSHFCIAQECGRSRHQHESSFWVSSVEVSECLLKSFQRSALFDQSWVCLFPNTVWSLSNMRTRVRKRKSGFFPHNLSWLFYSSSEKLKTYNKSSP